MIFYDHSFVPRMVRLLFGLLFCFFCHQILAIGEDDLVKVPGLIFNAIFKTYSGYLFANDAKTWKLHYMLTESRTDPANDPLLFWFNGGPGCSSFSGSFEELGPFYINKDNTTLFENVYAWNEHANVVYVESPVGTGFSYDTTNPSYFIANDDQTRDQNYVALNDFFKRVQPKYQNKTFFLSGESYAGIYLPMLGAKISEDKAFPAKLKGIAIGNGFMNVKMLTNSLILWSNYHGRFSLDEWNMLKSATCCESYPDADNCDWTKFLKTSNNIDYVGDTSNDCGKILNKIVNATGLYNIDPYNYYEDCYAGSLITYFGKPRRESYLNWKAAKDVTYHNTADLMNRDSTDPLWGYPCFQEDYVAGYFNKPEVQDAFHIDPAWRQANLTFADCNNNLYNNYKLTYDDMQPYFETMIKNLADFHILVYNGDVDTVCNFLGDAKFIDKVASANGFTHGDRQRWNFRRQLAGFYQRYTRAANNFVIDVLTVKGAGHMVPLDRPGPSLQMITNFLKNNDYNIGNSIDATAQPQPLLNIGTTTGKSGATLSAFSFVLSSAIFVLFLQI